MEFVTNYFPDFLGCYLSYPPGILRADIWRVLVLYKYGGVYADIDVECLRPLDELLEAVGHDDWELLLNTDHPIHERIHFGGRTMWMNDFMIAKPGSRFLKRVIEAFRVQALHNPTPAQAVMVTGPGLFSKLVEEAGGPEAAGITPMPWQWIHPLPDMSNEFPEKEGYLQMIRDRTWRDGHDPFVVHYWHHTWCREGNMLARWGHLLHQTDGEIVERRLGKLLESGDSTLRREVERSGSALAEFAQTGQHLAVLVEPEAALVRLVAESLAGLGREVICLAQESPFPGAVWQDELPPGVLAVEGEAKVNLPEPVIQAPGGSDLLNGPLVIRLVKHLNRQKGIKAGLVMGTRFAAEQMEWVAEGGWLALPAEPSPFDEKVWEHFPPTEATELFLLHRKKVEPFLIPRVLHLVAAPAPPGLEEICTRWQEKWRGICGPEWEVRLWSTEAVDDFMREEAGPFFDEWLDSASERSRVMTARYLILARLGGVAPEPDLPMAAELEDLLRGKRLVFAGHEPAKGALLEHMNAFDCSFIASVPQHPFWAGIEEDFSHARSASKARLPGKLVKCIKSLSAAVPRELTTLEANQLVDYIGRVTPAGQSPEDRECGNAFLTLRVRDGLRFWKKEDQPTVILLDSMLAGPWTNPMSMPADGKPYVNGGGGFDLDNP